MKRRLSPHAPAPKRRQVQAANSAVYAIIRPTDDHEIRAGTTSMEYFCDETGAVPARVLVPTLRELRIHCSMPNTEPTFPCTPDGEVVALPLLERLDVSHCTVASADGNRNGLASFAATLAALTHLTMRHMKLRSVPPWVWRLPRLANLDLSNNLLRHLSAAGATASQLRHINLTQNPVQGLPPWLTSSSIRVMGLLNKALRRPVSQSPLARSWRKATKAATRRPKRK